MMDEIRDLSEDEFLRLLRVIYEAGYNKALGDPGDTAIKVKLRVRTETWLEI